MQPVGALRMSPRRWGVIVDPVDPSPRSGPKMPRNGVLPKFGELGTPISINFPWFSARFALNQHKSAMFRYSPFTDTATLISQYCRREYHLAILGPSIRAEARPVYKDIGVSCAKWWLLIIRERDPSWIPPETRCFSSHWGTLKH